MLNYLKVFLYDDDDDDDDDEDDDDEDDDDGDEDDGDDDDDEDDEDDDDDDDGGVCPPTWDGWQCWEGGAEAGEVEERNCPAYIYFFTHGAHNGVGCQSKSIMDTITITIRQSHTNAT